MLQTFSVHVSAMLQVPHGTLMWEVLGIKGELKLMQGKRYTIMKHGPTTFVHMKILLL
jgi:hypothetical protein